MEFFIPSVFFSWVRRFFFFFSKVTVRHFFGFILSCQQPPNASESVSFYTVIFICLFYIRHSITFPHLPTYSPVITNAPHGCLQGNFMLEPVTALLFYFFIATVHFFLFYFFCSRSSYSYFGFLKTYEHTFKNECAIFIHTFF